MAAPRGKSRRETPEGLLVQARRLRGWSLRSHRTTEEAGGTLQVELFLAHRGAYRPPDARQLRDFDDWRVLGVTNSVMAGVATVWVRLAPKGQGAP